MLAKVFSGTIVGLEGVPVEVEVDIVKKGFPAFSIVGLPGKAIEEAKERVKSALLNSSAEFPNHRITVNLAPADLRKQGPSFDLPIAIGILIASEQIPSQLHDSLWLGELSLDGGVRPTVGVLPMAMLAKTHGLSRIFVPEPNVAEAAMVEDIEVIPVQSLNQLVHILHGRMEPTVVKTDIKTLFEQTFVTGEYDLADVYGQEQAKRALEIAAAGGHNLLMTGPPGAGKTLLARTLPSIMPVLNVEEALEVTKIYSIAGRLNTNNPLLVKRPFRSPHHTTSRIGLIGGGQHITPGEVSLAHRGVLFLDEFPEFPRSVLESLRQPLEDGEIHISRASGTVRYPARFMLVAAANPCPCGNWGSEKSICTCSPNHVKAYQKRVSGPLLDRIDLHVRASAVEVEKVMQGQRQKNSVSSAIVHARVQHARTLQTQRFGTGPRVINAEMNAHEIREHCVLDADCKILLSRAIQTYSLSVRGVHKILKVARTIADLAESSTITSVHLAEAINYRQTQ